MITVKVKFRHRNGFDKTVFVTSENLNSLLTCKTEEGMIILAVKYVKRRWTECTRIISCEIEKGEE